MIDLLTMKAYAGDGKTAVDIPAEYADAAEEARMELIEFAAEGDDELLMKYLEGEELIIRGNYQWFEICCFSWHIHTCICNC